MRGAAFFGIVSQVLLLWTVPGESSPLRAGVAEVEITPPPGQSLIGQNGDRPAKAVHDPLLARVLVLRTSDSSLALVTSDLNRLHTPTLIERISQSSPFKHTILASSHNHSAPGIAPGGGAGGWQRETEDKILEAIKAANANLFSARISWGRGALIGCHNIRIPTEDGGIQERWSNPEEEGTAPIDPSVTVMRVDDQTGRSPRAVLVHYSCEPAVLDPGNGEISAEFPGALARYVKEELGADVVPLFAAGGSANVYPFRPLLAGPEAYAEIAKMGERLGREAVRVARGLEPTDSENELQVRSDLLAFRNRWDGSKQLEVGVSTVLINGALALVAVPGEMFVEFGLALSAKSPIATTLLLGSSYSGGSSWGGYFPTIAAAVEGGFAASYGTEVEAGAGEAVVDRGVIELYRFIGKLDSLPRGRLVTEIPDLASP